MHAEKSLQVTKPTLYVSHSHDSALATSWRCPERQLFFQKNQYMDMKLTSEHQIQLPSAAWFEF